MGIFDLKIQTKLNRGVTLQLGSHPAFLSLNPLPNPLPSSAAWQRLLTFPTDVAH